MNVLITTASLLIVALAAHLIVWRIRLPKHHIKTLLVIFAAVFSAWLLVWAPVSSAFPEVLQTGLCYFSMSLAYAITYSAIEGDSPTLSLMLLIAQNNDRGVPASEVSAFLSRRPFVNARLTALIHSGLVREADGRLFVAGSPSLAFRTVLGFRKLYGSIPKGG